MKQLKSTAHNLVNYSINCSRFESRQIPDFSVKVLRKVLTLGFNDVIKPGSFGACLPEGLGVYFISRCRRQRRILLRRIQLQRKMVDVLRRNCA